ncbi:terminase gpP N-terminus-related DNA-binding protein [Nocardia tengchongensis]
MTAPTMTPRGRGVARTGFVFGSLTSVATNVLHTYLPTIHMPTGLTLVIAARVGSAVWPLGLLLSVEVLARVSWRRGRGWSIARFGGAGAVAFGSAVISYSHVRDVLLAWGYGHPAAEFGPLTLDGLMVVCGFALLSLTPANPDNTAEQEAAAGIEQRQVQIRDPKPSPAQEIPLTTQIEALPHPVSQVATVSGQPGSPAPCEDNGPEQADNLADPVTAEPGQADTEPDIRRERARELHHRGWTHGRIAAELAVSKRTVRRYLSAHPDTTDTADIRPADPAEATANAGLAGADFDWLTAVNTNHHNEREGALS